MDSTRESLTPSTRDPLRTYSAAELARLTENLDGLTTTIHAGELSAEPLTVALICALHRAVFDGVRDHAGKHRDVGRGSERLTFGPHRSTERDDVARELTSIVERAERSARSLAENTGDPAYEQFAFHTAVWTHAAVIRVHPFEDGNGRTSRALLNYLLVRFGLRPVAMELCRDEYIALLNEYFNSGAIQPLLDGIIRLASQQLANEERLRP